MGSRVNVSLPDEVLADLREVAAEHGMTPGALAHLYIQQGLYPADAPADPPDFESMAAAVEAALSTAGTERRDEGTRALARRYAALIDAAAMPGRFRKALEVIRIVVENHAELTNEADDAYHKIAAALSQATVTSDLGPKLLAALVALELTPAARRDPKGGGTNAKPGAGSTIGKLRNDVEAQRRKREQRAGAG